MSDKNESLFGLPPTDPDNPFGLPPPKYPDSLFDMPPPKHPESMFDLPPSPFPESPLGLPPIENMYQRLQGESEADYSARIVNQFRMQASEIYFRTVNEIGAQPDANTLRRLFGFSE